MIKFDDPIIETLCESILTPQENKLKIIHAYADGRNSGDNIMLGAFDPTYNQMLEDRIKQLEYMIAQTKKAIAINSMAIALKSTLIEEKENV